VPTCVRRLLSAAAASLLSIHSGLAQSGNDSQSASPPEHFEPVPSRWYAPGHGLPGLDPRDYEINEVADAWNPYRQHRLKGDFPLFGTQDVFLNLSATARFLAEAREVPTPTGISGPNTDFFGDGDQSFFVEQLAVGVDLFRGQQAFKPVDWRLRLTPVVHHSTLSVEERGVAFVDVSEGTRRDDGQFTLQEAFAEVHLFDVSNHYDFVSSEVGVLPFRSDFRGFVFDDTNLGARLFGNADSNRWQYNLVFFDMLNKDTNSGLNEFEDRQQEVVIANVYRQDWPVLGYTTSFSFHYNDDHRGTHFDDNGFLVSPAPIGLAREHEVESYYLGWAGDGRLGRFNVTNALYHAFGRDTDNPIAARETDIRALLGALEVSYDVDWMRLRAFGLWASGDDDARDGDAEGFDAILDAPNFAGGGLSFFNSQALRLLGVNLTNAGSPLPDLQSSQTEGQSNFVNPGLVLLGGAFDAELTPKWRGQIGASYLRFDESEVLETYLELDEVEKEIGTEIFLGTQYRPLLTNNVILSLGASALLPGAGFERIYQSDDVVYTTFFNLLLSW
jgi:hypothetical protein